MIDEPIDEGVLVPTGMRHVLSDDHWEAQCPICRQFVPINRAVFTGISAFPKHQKWTPSFVHTFAEKHELTFPLARLLYPLVYVEVWLRRHLPRGPWCAYQPTCDLSSDLYQASGISSFGPTA